MSAPVADILFSLQPKYIDWWAIWHLISRQLWKKCHNHLQIVDGRKPSALRHSKSVQNSPVSHREVFQFEDQVDEPPRPCDLLAGGAERSDVRICHLFNGFGKQSLECPLE